MTKEREALKLALEALEEAWYHVGTFQPTEKAIDLYDEARTAIKEALANEALEKMAENARELGLDYEPEQDWIERERAVGYREGHQNALKQLAQPEQEPVTCVEYIPCCTDQTCPKCKAAIKPELVCVCGAVWEGQELIYTTPQRTWVGLNEEERRGLREWQEIQKELGPVWAPMMLYLYEAIEAKLKEKNT